METNQKDADNFIKIINLLIKIVEKVIEHENSKVGFKLPTQLKKLYELENKKKMLFILQKWAGNIKKFGEEKFSVIIFALILKNVLTELQQEKEEFFWSTFLEESNFYCDKLNLNDFESDEYLKKIGLK